MKRVFCFLLSLLLLFCPCALAGVSLSDSPIHLDSTIAANEFGASYAYFSPLDDAIYYLKTSSEGTSVVLFDAEVSDYKTIKTFSPEADYISISADIDGNLYLLRRDHDETAKSGIVCLFKENDSYIPIEYLFPAASGDMIPVSFEISPLSSMGVMRFFMINQGEYVPFVSPLSYFWNSLTGYEELLYIIPGDATAKIQPLTDFFDAYGYQTETAREFLNEVENERFLTPYDVSLSPDGCALLMLVSFNGETLIYVMDLYTYELQQIYLPEEFDGSISWNENGSIQTTDENGYVMNAEWNGFSQ